MAEILPQRKEPTPEEMEIAVGIVQGFMARRTLRYNFETQWQESSAILWPEYQNKFFFGYEEWPGMKKTQYQVDSHGAIALWRFGSICDAMITPFGHNWSPLRPRGKNAAYLWKRRRVREYYDDLSNCLFAARYAPHANFIDTNQTSWQSLGAFGNRNVQVDAVDQEVNPGCRGLRYCLQPVGHIYYITNHQGQVVGYYRTFKYTAQQYKDAWPDSFPPMLETALRQRSPNTFWGIQAVFPRKNWQPWRVDALGKRWASYYICLTGNWMLEHEGYRCMPMPAGRYMVAPDEEYGRGCAQMVLPALKTKNAEKADFLTTGHFKARPVLLTPEDGLMDTSWRPGATNKGGMSRDGKPLIGTLPSGDMQDIEVMMAEEAKHIDAAFLVDLYKWALQPENQSQLGARQVLELVSQRGQLLAPTLGRQMAFYAHMVERELDLLAWQRMLPEMPGELREAKGEYGTSFDNPMIRAMRAGKAAALMQLVEMTEKVAQSTGDDEVWDNYEWDVALPEVGDDLGVPQRWISSPQSLAKKRKQRADAADREAQIKAMPAQAAIIKAKAISDKAGAGQNIGGTLSGTPEGGMPEIPGNPQGQPGQPGVGGAPGLPGRPG